MSEQKELNFFELCVLCAKGIGRGIVFLWRWAGKTVRLTLRKWWITFPAIALLVGLAFYYTRQDNLTYKVQAIAALNGPTLDVFEQAFRPLQGGLVLGETDSPIRGYLKSNIALRPETFHVIDINCDSTIDYVDYKQAVPLGDTTIVQDYVALQFRIKQKNISHLARIEEAMMTYLNDNAALQLAYHNYLPLLDREARFYHDQIEKLDSLTSVFYFQEQVKSMDSEKTDNMIWVGDRGARRIYLFLPEIYSHIDRTKHLDQRKRLATAPVVLTDHFVINPAPVNSRLKCIVLFGLAGYVLGLLIALVVEQRKTICAWLKK